MSAPIPPDIEKAARELVIASYLHTPMSWEQLLEDYPDERDNFEADAQRNANALLAERERAATICRDWADWTRDNAPHGKVETALRMVAHVIEHGEKPEGMAARIRRGEP